MSDQASHDFVRDGLSWPEAVVPGVVRQSEMRQGKRVASLQLINKLLWDYSGRALFTAGTESRRSEPRHTLALTFVLSGVLALTACASFNDLDDDPALCENGRRPTASGECRVPFVDALTTPGKL
ncbi:MAG: hypothetical protein NT015_12505 [Alphaproteobacteria bacterium]|nr:hypothetical protein [Alphaproteobacteria bacterium]